MCQRREGIVAGYSAETIEENIKTHPILADAWDALTQDARDKILSEWINIIEKEIVNMYGSDSSNKEKLNA